MTQKRQTTKKAPVTKKASTQKGGSAKKAPRLTWKFYVVTIGIFLVAVMSVIVIALFTAHTIATRMNQERLEHIKDIYTSLNIDDSYKLESSDVFGDKRVYTWDRGRTYSSTVRYLKGDTVSNTVAELDAKIKDAGFAYVGEPYPGSKSIQYHYKSKDGEYIRLTVESKVYTDAVMNNSAMNRVPPTQDIQSIDTNAGPALVTIKVNLDDNNE